MGVVCVSCRHDLASMRAIPSVFARSFSGRVRIRAAAADRTIPDNKQTGMHHSCFLGVFIDSFVFQDEEGESRWNRHREVADRATSEPRQATVSIKLGHVKVCQTPGSNWLGGKRRLPAGWFSRSL